jgi:hypothetical protein
MAQPQADEFAWHDVPLSCAVALWAYVPEAAVSVRDATA